LRSLRAGYEVVAGLARVLRRARSVRLRMTIEIDGGKQKWGSGQEYEEPSVPAGWQRLS
jgi:hypothetical protein